jgi:tetratricopeptide (TPR) repeat protein
MGEVIRVAGGSKSLLEVAETCRQAGRLIEARRHFLDAAAAADEDGDKQSLVAAALGAGGLWVHEHRDVVERARVQALWERALDLAERGSLDEARLVVRTTAEGVYNGEPIEPVVAAVEVVRGFGVDRAVAEALSTLHHVMLGPEDADARLQLAGELITSAARANDQLLALMGLCWRTVDLFLLGDSRARQSLTELRERSAAADCAALTFVTEVLDAMLLARAGKLEEAEQAAALAFERGTSAGDPDAPAYYGAMMAALRWWQGRATEILDVVRSITASPRLGLNDHAYVAAEGLLSATVGDLDAAEEALARLNGIGLGNLPRSSTWLTAQLLAIQTAYLLGDAETATAAAEQLRPYAKLPVMPSLAVVCLGSAEYGLGLAAVLTGGLDDAVAHLQSALRVDRRLGSRPMATLTEHALAQALTARAAPGDAELASDLEQRAQDRVQGMGLVLPERPSWLRSPRRRSGSKPTRHAVIDRVEGGRWRIEIDGRSTLFADRVGMSYLAQLVGKPGQDVDVFALATDGRLPREPAEPVLDDEALRQYRERARKLHSLLERGTASSEESERYRTELQTLTEGLRIVSRLGGRSRSFVGNHERARTAVRKALVRAIDVIACAEPSLGDHLVKSIGTGASCRYTPDPSWSVTVGVKPPALSNCFAATEATAFECGGSR